MTPFPLFLSAHDRPIYLYMTLDALRRATYSPHRLYVLLHRGGAEQVQEVLDMFIARGVITEVLAMNNVSIELMRKLTYSRLRPDDEFVFYIEEDVVVERSETCWMARMIDAFDADDKLAFIGSLIDIDDFIDPGALANDLGRDLSPVERDAIKANSPERRILSADSPWTRSVIGNQELFSGHNPPGRLAAARLKALRGIPLSGDRQVHQDLQRNGWRTGILKSVRHRHLSLGNYYDYPHYIQRRQALVAQRSKELAAARADEG